MKKYVLIYGGIAGAVMGAMLLFMGLSYTPGKFDPSGGEVVGYASMFLAFAMIFVGVKLYRDRECGGYISFGKAFKVAILITLIATFVYSLTWEFVKALWMPNFYSEYADCIAQQMKDSGSNQQAIDARLNEMKWWNDHVFAIAPLRFLATGLVEAFPPGLFMSLIASLVFKKKQK